MDPQFRITIPILVRALGDESSVVRANAAELLRWIGPESLPALREAAAHGADEPTRQGAAQVIERIEKLSAGPAARRASGG